MPERGSGRDGSAGDLPSGTPGDAIRLCASSELAERGHGVLFEVAHWGDTVRAFALRIDGHPVAYLNSCRHVPVELDWQPGRFLDDTGDWIICSVHGAVYRPDTGACAGGPCQGRGLVRIEVDERDGNVYWYASDDIQPVTGTIPPAD